MPKFYWKTVAISSALGVILWNLATGALQLTREVAWGVATLVIALAINEKMTIRERWGLRHVVMLAALSYVAWHATGLLGLGCAWLCG